MNSQKDNPMPNMVFKMMSFMLALRHRFANLRKELEKSGIKEGQTILDFGCGPGHYAIAAARIVGEKGRIYALDIHPLAMRVVEKKARKEGLTNITTILSDRDTGLPDESIDIVLLYDTIHLIGDKRALLKELHRVMKSSGILSIWGMKVEDVLELVEKEGLFALRERVTTVTRYRHGKLLNFEKG